MGAIGILFGAGGELVLFKWFLRCPCGAQTSASKMKKKQKTSAASQGKEKCLNVPKMPSFLVCSLHCSAASLFSHTLK